MAQYNSLDVKLSNLQLNKVKSAIKNKTEVVLRLSSNIISNSDDAANFSYKLLLQIDKLQIFVKILQIINQLILSHQKLNYLRFGRLLGPLLKTGLPLMKNLFKPLAKGVLISLGLTLVASAAADVGIHKKILGSGTTALKIQIMKWKTLLK